VTRTYRDTWIGALSGLLQFAEDLKTRTEAMYGATEPYTVVRSTILVGLRGRRLLQGASLLAEHEWDDLVANLGRALVDAAIEMDYLSVTTMIGKGTKRRTLTPEDKARLFESQRFLLLDMKTEELDPEQSSAQAYAIKLREELGVRIGHTWHGRTTKGLLADLKAQSDEELQKGLDAVAQAFRISSFFEHNNANPSFYVERRSRADVKVLDTLRHSWPVQTAVKAGAIVLNRWGEVLGLGEVERIKRLEPVLRMTGVDPVTFSSDS
jgi:hypothetical protein